MLFRSDIAKTAQALLNAGVQPKIKTVHNLKDDKGNPVPGYYDPKTDTIYLDDVHGMNHHVVLHEFGHAALSHTLNNPNHPVTKQLQALFNETKDSLDSMYGATDLQEFAAEAMGNPEFRAKLNAWKDAIYREAAGTLNQLQSEPLREADLTDRASSETDWSIELRTRDRQRKLISKIDAALRRIDEGEYGYCEVTGEPISLGRLEARPIATMTVEAQERHERQEKISRDD